MFGQAAWTQQLPSPPANGLFGNAALGPFRSDPGYSAKGLFGNSHGHSSFGNSHSSETLDNAQGHITFGQRSSGNAHGHPSGGNTHGHGPFGNAHGPFGNAHGHSSGGNSHGNAHGHGPFGNAHGHCSGGNAHGQGPFGNAHGHSSGGNAHGQGPYGNAQGHSSGGNAHGQGPYGNAQGHGPFGNAHGHSSGGNAHGHGPFGNAHGHSSGGNAQGQGSPGNAHGHGPIGNAHSHEPHANAQGYELFGGGGFGHRSQQSAGSGIATNGANHSSPPSSPNKPPFGGNTNGNPFSTPTRSHLPPPSDPPPISCSQCGWDNPPHASLCERCPMRFTGSHVSSPDSTLNGNGANGFPLPPKFGSPGWIQHHSAGTSSSHPGTKTCPGCGADNKSYYHTCSVCKFQFYIPRPRGDQSVSGHGSAISPPGHVGPSSNPFAQSPTFTGTPHFQSGTAQFRGPNGTSGDPIGSNVDHGANASHLTKKCVCGTVSPMENQWCNGCGLKFDLGRGVSAASHCPHRPALHTRAQVHINNVVTSYTVISGTYSDQVPAPQQWKLVTEDLNYSKALLLQLDHNIRQLQDAKARITSSAIKAFSTRKSLIEQDIVFSQAADKQTLTSSFLSDLLCGYIPEANRSKFIVALKQFLPDVTPAAPNAPKPSPFHSDKAGQGSPGNAHGHIPGGNAHGQGPFGTAHGQTSGGNAHGQGPFGNAPGHSSGGNAHGQEPQGNAHGIDPVAYAAAPSTPTPGKRPPPVHAIDTDSEGGDADNWRDDVWEVPCAPMAVNPDYDASEIFPPDNDEAETPCLPQVKRTRLRGKQVQPVTWADTEQSDVGEPDVVIAEAAPPVDVPIVSSDGDLAAAASPHADSLSKTQCKNLQKRAKKILGKGIAGGESSKMPVKKN